MIYQDEITEKVAAEISRQDQKWGPDRTLHQMQWLAILMEEIGEASKDIVEMEWTSDIDHRQKHFDNLQKELIQVAAVAMQFANSLEL